MKSLLNNILMLKCRLFGRTRSVGICRVKQVFQKSTGPDIISNIETLYQVIEACCLLQYYVLLNNSINFKYWYWSAGSLLISKNFGKHKRQSIISLKSFSKHEKVKKSKMNKTTYQNNL